MGICELFWLAFAIALVTLRTAVSVALTVAARRTEMMRISNAANCYVGRVACHGAAP